MYTLSGGMLKVSYKSNPCRYFSMFYVQPLTWSLFQKIHTYYFERISSSGTSRPFQICIKSPFSGFISLLTAFFHFFGPKLAISLIQTLRIVYMPLNGIFHRSLVALEISFISLYWFIYIMSHLVYANRWCLRLIIIKILQLYSFYHDFSIHLHRWF